ncbi:uncharacterized protein JN550_000966 [Neoarthrinium moseri]|uniref:uncharacterized protein n=1 Tax=Neoarthrinium moseri TaxID=1658444 RepID=UPI001FDC95B7|nr:uncharacterized protein JN550_000966 [Neoarthrinium moseri]KAI1876894.1 hypothetical protein JN550_000966 [Neoarthrinium moseri]
MPNQHKDSHIDPRLRELSPFDLSELENFHLDDSLFTPGTEAQPQASQVGDAMMSGALVDNTNFPGYPEGPYPRPRQGFSQRELEDQQNWVNDLQIEANQGILDLANNINQQLSMAQGFRVARNEAAESLLASHPGQATNANLHSRARAMQAESQYLGTTSQQAATFQQHAASGQAPQPMGINPTPGSGLVPTEVPGPRRATATDMQCAPITGGRAPPKKVTVDISDDGTPRVVTTDGEDGGPIRLSDIVARPRSEQITAPRAGQPPLKRVKINKRSTRVPYLPINDDMSDTERLRRAMRNQEMAEIDRAEKRARNNAAARRTREKREQMLANQRQTIAQQQQSIAALQSQLDAAQTELKRKRRRNDDADNDDDEFFEKRRRI